MSLAPHPAVPPSTAPTRAWRRVAAHGLQVVAANLLIAALIAAIAGRSFGRIAVYSQCIGLSIWSLAETGRHLVPNGKGPGGWPTGWRAVAMMTAACVGGYAIGSTVAGTIFGQPRWWSWLAEPGFLLREVAPTGVFCALISGWFYVRAQARNQRERAVAASHEATLARLTLLQSQLEPHMLFNTLANLRALIGADPARAQEMLDRLIDFLRATLVASRSASHPLATEFARIDDYLALMRIRMGARLDAGCALPPELATLPVPPLLLQPLVENAIKHGLEPQRGPGTLRVEATRDGQTLVLAVIDSGRGLEAARAAAAEPGAEGTGFGVAQVRERLQTMFGDAASFTLTALEPRGTRAEIRMPIHDLPSSLTPTPCPPL